MTTPEGNVESELKAADTLAVHPFLSLKDGGTEIYLIRHADALPGAEEVVAGDYDAQALSATGRAQVQALGEALRDTPFAAVYSSPIGRAVQTAQAVAVPHELPVLLDEEIREIALGPIGDSTGSTISAEEQSQALRDRLNEIARVALGTGMWTDIPGSEPSTALRARMRGAVERIAAAHPGKRVALVSHGGAINAYVAAILGIERDYFFPCANTSISVVRVKGQRHLLMTLNDVAHLRAAGLLGSGRSGQP